MATTHRYRLLLRRDASGVWVCVEDRHGEVRHGPFTSEDEAERCCRWPMIRRWTTRARGLGGHVLRASAGRVFVVLPDAVMPRRPGLREADRPCSVASAVTPVVKNPRLGRDRRDYKRASMSERMDSGVSREP